MDSLAAKGACAGVLLQWPKTPLKRRRPVAGAGDAPLMLPLLALWRFLPVTAPLQLM